MGRALRVCAVILLLLTAAAVLPENSFDAVSGSIHQEYNLNPQASFTRLQLIAADYTVSAVTTEESPLWWNPSDNNSIIVHHPGTESLCTVILGPPGAKTQVPERRITPGTGGLTLSVRMLSHEHMREVSHNLQALTGTALADYIRTIDVGRIVEKERQRIHDTRNPFGRNDFYISRYSGYLYCPFSGVYTFATDSDDGSLLLVNGIPAVEWGGHHTAANSWKHQGAIKLESGIYPFEYYHFDLGGGQKASAAWKKPGDKEFKIIDEMQFIAMENASCKRVFDDENAAILFPAAAPLNKGIELHGREYAWIRFAPHGYRTPEFKGWTIGGIEYPDTQISLLLPVGERVPYTMHGSPLKSLPLIVPQPDESIPADGAVSISGLMPLVFNDEAVSIWLQAERFKGEGELECQIVEQRLRANGTVYAENTYPVTLGPAGARVPGRIPMAVNSIQTIWDMGELTNGVSARYMMLCGGLEIDTRHLRCIAADAEIEGIRAEQGNYLDQNGVLICFSDRRENEDEWRKWRLIKWAAAQAAAAQKRIVMFGEVSGRDGDLSEVLKQEYPDLQYSKADSDDLYPSARIALEAETLAETDIPDAVIIAVSNRDVEDAIADWRLVRYIDFAVSRFRQIGIQRIILIGPLPMAGLEKRAASAAAELSALAARHHIDFIDLGDALKTNNGTDYFINIDVHYRLPDRSGIELICDKIREIL